MASYLFRLLPPRPDFGRGDLTVAEAMAMREHVAYWSALLAEGKVVAFGPVADPRGAYGIGVVTLEDGADPQALADRDPVMQAGIGFSVEILPMPRLVARD